MPKGYNGRIMARPPVYLDHIATTPCAPEVVEAIRAYLSGPLFHNPQSAYPPAEEALDADPWDEHRPDYRVH